MLVTTADTRTSCVPSVAPRLTDRSLNANCVYESPNPNGNNGAMSLASYQRYPTSMPSEYWTRAVPGELGRGRGGHLTQARRERHRQVPARIGLPEQDARQ